MIGEDPVFLTLGEVIEIHRDQIERYGGDPGIRDLGVLQSDGRDYRQGARRAILSSA